MRSKFSFARALSLALVAAGTVAGLSTDTFAAPRTWTPITSGSLAGRWGTSSIYAGNWTPSTTPTATDTAIFNSSSFRTVQTVSGNVLPIGSMVFAGSGSTQFTNGGTILISGEGTPVVGISSTATAGVGFAGKVVVNSAQQKFTTTGGLLNFTGNVDLNGNYLKGEGPINISALGSAVAGATYEVTSGTQTVNFDGTTGGNVASFVVNGGRVTSGGNETTDLSVQGGNYFGGGTFNIATSSSGKLQMDNSETLAVSKFVQTAGGTIEMNVMADQTSATVSGNYQLGGAMVLEGSNLGSSTYNIGTTWGLFSGVNLTSGTASAPNNASNFSQFAFTTSSSTSPYYGTWTRYGQEWSSPAAPNGTYLVFQAATGNLIVVPEPSTMVFAGLGVAMSGWTMWKKRRLAKLLAAKAG